MTKKTSNFLLYLTLPISLFGFLNLFIYSSEVENDETEHQKNISENYNIFSLSPPKDVLFAEEKVP
jgi:hypothetical protein